MERANIILENGSQKEVDCLFYLYNSKYYFIYTEKEIDSSGYVVLNVVQVGKEVNQTLDGPVDTGYMLGVDIKDEAESEAVQSSITKIVEDMKNGTKSSDIQYLPITMLTNLKILSKKTFRLLKSIVEQYFKLNFDNTVDNFNENSTEEQDSVYGGYQVNNPYGSNSDVIVDYRTKYYEEQEKIKELEQTITDLSAKLSNIKDIIG